MEIIQSRGQFIFSKVYSGLFELFGVVIGAIIVNITVTEPGSVYFGLLVSLALPLFYAVWLLVFNTGSGKVIENAIQTDEKQLSYIHFGKAQSIDWSNYRGYSINGRWRPTVVLLSKDNHNIEFDYYTFSGDQRRQLFAFLTSKTGAQN